MGKTKTAKSSTPHAPTTYQSVWYQLQALEQLFNQVGDTGKNRLQTDIEKSRESIFAADPLTKGLYENVLAGVSGDPSELPSDFQEGLLRDVRGSQAARGTLDSDTSALQEAVVLMGGREKIRSQRLAQASQFLTSGVLPGYDQFMPSMRDLLGAQQGLSNLEINRGLNKERLFNDRMNSIASNSNDTVSSVGGIVGGLI